MWIAVLGGVLFSFAGLLALGWRKPSMSRVERSGFIASSPVVVHGLIGDLRRWRDWSAASAADPDMRRTYAGPAEGVGAHHTWDSDKSKVGAGALTIVESTPDRVKVKVSVTKPLRSEYTMTFVLQPKDSGTMLLWQFEGEKAPAIRLLSVLVDFDKLVGQDLEVGLRALQELGKAR